MTNEDQPNIVLVTVDSLRADHCGFMGYEKDTTPTSDVMVKEGIGSEPVACYRTRPDNRFAANGRGGKYLHCPIGEGVVATRERDSTGTDLKELRELSQLIWKRTECSLMERERMVKIARTVAGGDSL